MISYSKAHSTFSAILFGAAFLAYAFLPPQLKEYSFLLMLGSIQASILSINKR